MYVYSILYIHMRTFYAMWLTLFFVAAEWNLKLLFANVHVSLSPMNANAMLLLLLLTHAAWWLNWCKHGKELDVTPEFRLWTELSERGPISQSLVSGLMPPCPPLTTSQYQDLRSTLTVSLHGNDLQSPGLPKHKTAATAAFPSLSKQHSIFFPRCFLNLNILHAVLKFLCLTNSQTEEIYVCKWLHGGFVF